MILSILDGDSGLSNECINYHTGTDRVDMMIMDGSKLFGLRLDPTTSHRRDYQSYFKDRLDGLTIDGHHTDNV